MAIQSEIAGFAADKVVSFFPCREFYVPLDGYSGADRSERCASFDLIDF